MCCGCGKWALRLAVAQQVWQVRSGCDKWDLGCGEGDTNLISEIYGCDKACGGCDKLTMGAKRVQWNKYAVGAASGQ